MTSAAALGIAVVFGWAITTVLFGKKRAKWHPFGGMFTRDWKTGAITMALTLPTKRSVKRRKR